MAIVFKSEKERIAFLRSQYEETPIEPIKREESMKPKKEKETETKKTKKNVKKASK